MDAAEDLPQTPFYLVRTEPRLGKRGTDNCINISGVGIASKSGHDPTKGLVNLARTTIGESFGVESV